MRLRDLLEHNKNAQAYQNKLPIDKQIEHLKTYKKSVFTFHMEDGTKLVRGDSESNQKEMKEFFKNYPQEGVAKIEFHK